MQVREVMSDAPASVRPDASIASVAVQMRDLDIGFLPVCDGDRVVGTVTDRDIVVRTVAARADPSLRTVFDAMTADVVACHADDSIEEAAERMAERQVRRLVVLDRDQKLVGVVSLGDLSTRTHDERVSAATLEAVSEDRVLPI